MICPHCKREIPEDLTHCIHCGSPLKSSRGNQYMEGGGWKDYIIYIIVFAALVIIAIGGLVFWLWNPKKPGTPPAGGGETATVASTATDSSDTASTTSTSDDSTIEEDLPEEESLSLPYTDNKKCAIKKNLSPDAFKRYKDEKGGFSFSYPKYLFNNFSYDPDRCEYYFSYENGGDTICSMRVYREEDPSSDAVEKAAEIKRRFNSQFYQGKYWWPVRDTNKLTSDPNSANKEPRGDGYARYIMSGWEDPARTQIMYALGANDYSYTYYLEFSYPEYDTDNDLEDWDYVVECVYRKCSFSGTNYEKLRSYKKFKKEGYGEGHH